MIRVRRRPGRVDGGTHVRPGDGRAKSCLVLVSMLLATTSIAHATTYRCELDGRVSYSDSPCTSGRQSTIAREAAVDPGEQDAAAERGRRDRAAIAQIDRDRERERQQDLRALAQAKKRDGDIARHAQACTKLARRARHAHDAFDLAGPRDQAKDRLKMQRADQDFAALCKR